MCITSMYGARVSNMVPPLCILPLTRPLRHGTGTYAGVAVAERPRRVQARRCVRGRGQGRDSELRRRQS